ncbi:MAG TPA: ATP-binding protein [Candidatus Angelobacter sp.]
MHPSPTARQQWVAWFLTMSLPVAAWICASYTFSHFSSGVVLFFTLAACLSAVVGGMRFALIAIVLNMFARNLFWYLHAPGEWRWANTFWSLIPVTLILIVGYARGKWLAADGLAAGLSGDLARLREELELQRTDLRGFHNLSVRLSSNLELQQMLGDILTSITALLKTDLALLLLLPEKTSRFLHVETFAGFSDAQINLFGKFPVSFFSLDRPIVVEDIDRPGTNFPFADAAAQVGFRAAFSAPIVNAKGEPLGVVVTLFRTPHAPSERQSRLVQLYALQAANALDNARRYRESLQTLAAEQQRTAVLRALAEASVQIHSALSLDSLLQVITDQARNIIGTSQAFTTLLAKGAWHQSMTCFSAADGQPAFEFPQANSETFMLACTLNKPVRLTAAKEGNWPWAKTDEAPQHGSLAAPLVTRDGRNLGLIHLSHKIAGEFSPDDEAILVQLAHMASVAVDNVRLYREAQEQIAETKRTQEALERSKESMQLAQQCVGIGIWEWDLENGELVWSDEIRRLHGCAADTFDGRYESWMESIHPDDRRHVHDAITRAFAINGEYEIQYRVLLPEKSVHWLEARGRTIVIGNTPVRMLGVAMDVTARKMSEEALRSSEKLAATGRLAASIAHEINNPLAAVTNALYILRTGTQVPGAALEYIKTAEAELSRVVHITKQTLGFYRELAAPVMTSVPGLLDEVLSAYDTKIEKGNIGIHKQYRGDGQLAAFPGELRQVFSNLVLNALEAVANTGTVSVRVKEVHNGQEQHCVQVTVADNGLGIPPANMPRIFEPFFSTKDSKGTGLGLWVSQGIVEKHGGAIRVRSSVAALHHGTCFMIFLPFHASAAHGRNQEIVQTPTRTSLGLIAKAASGNDLTAA